MHLTEEEFQELFKSNRSLKRRNLNLNLDQNKTQAVSNQAEYTEAKRLVQYLNDRAIPFYHVPNETWTSSHRQKKINQATGVQPGVPDYFIYIPINESYHCIAIELKRKEKSKASISKLQKHWLSIINQTNGIAGFVAYGADQAIQIIETYENSLKQSRKD